MFFVACHNAIDWNLDTAEAGKRPWVIGALQEGEFLEKRSLVCRYYNLHLGAWIIFEQR